MDISKYIYFDNNATVSQTTGSMKMQMKWSRCSNGSAQNPVARLARDECNKFEQIIRNDMSITEKSHAIIWTSGTSEANCTIVNMFCESVNTTNTHIVCTSIEHKCLLSAVKQAYSRGTPVTWIDPMPDGSIDPADVISAVNTITVTDPSTRILVCIMHANNETGAINDIETIGAYLSDPNIFFHVDMAQTFAKIPLNMQTSNVSSIGASGHKIGGPFGVGPLIVSRRFLQTVGIESGTIFIPINGEQNDHLRGGTYNIPGILGMYAAYTEAIINHEKHMKTLIANRKKFLVALNKQVPVLQYSEDVRVPSCPCVMVFSGQNSLPSTILMSIVYIGGPEEICNIKLRKYLESKKIIVSLGSACNSKSNGSHVLNAMQIPRDYMLGTIRISAWNNDWSDYQSLISALVSVMNNISTVCIPRK